MVKQLIPGVSLLPVLVLEVPLQQVGVSGLDLLHDVRALQLHKVGAEGDDELGQEDHGLVSFRGRGVPGPLLTKTNLCSICF